MFEKIISWPISIIGMSLFLLTLVVFHPIQWICFHLFGYQAHKKSVDILNLVLLRIGQLIGNTYEVKGRELIPHGVPLIFVANHQSLFDIIGIVWYMRAFHPKFVSKKELGKIPSISFNLKHGGSVMIDRNDPKQAIPQIKKLAEYIEKTGRTAVIFPEGTRTKDGTPKPFQQSGLKILCKFAPSAYVVPITINGSWKFVKHGFLPFGLGTHMSFTVHQPMAVKDHPFDELMSATEKVVVEAIKN